MKLMFFFLVFPLTIQTVLAGNGPYSLVDESDCSTMWEHHISTNPIVRDQTELGIVDGAAGYCYAYSGLNLLEHLICQQNQSCLLRDRTNSLSVRSSLDAYYYRTPRFHRGELSRVREEMFNGNVREFLQSLQNQPIKSEECLTQKANSQCSISNVDLIREHNLLELLQAGHYLSPFGPSMNCSDEEISLPNYRINMWHGNIAFLKNLTEELISQDIPISYIHCLPDSENSSPRRDCPNRHWVTIVGVKRINCGLFNRPILVRVINSRGQEWQSEHNDGWILADDLFRWRYQNSHEPTEANFYTISPQED